MPYYKNNRSNAPAVTTGHLYYVRLKTGFGPMYKLGFTTLPSLEERFAYQGQGDEALLDRQLLFAFRDDAYHIEQQLHCHFSDKRAFGRYSSNRTLPLYQNGQSEIYLEDILQLDLAYSKEQAEKTRARLREARVHGMPDNPWWWTPVMLAIALPFRLVIATTVVLLRTVEHIFDTLGKVPQNKRGTLFGAADERERLADEQRRQVEIGRLLDWARANRSDASFAQVSTSAATSLKQQSACNGASPHDDVLDDVVFFETPSAALAEAATRLARPPLVNFGQATLSNETNAWLKVWQHLQCAEPSTAAAASVRLTAAYGLTVASAKLYSESVIDLQTFRAAVGDLRGYDEQSYDNWVQVVGQFADLAKPFGLSVSTADATAIMSAASRRLNENKVVSPIGHDRAISREEFDVERALRRAKLGAKKAQFRMNQPAE